MSSATCRPSCSLHVSHIYYVLNFVVIASLLIVGTIKITRWIVFEFILGIYLFLGATLVYFLDSSGRWQQGLRKQLPLFYTNIGRAILFLILGGLLFDLRYGTQLVPAVFVLLS